MPSFGLKPSSGKHAYGLNLAARMQQEDWMNAHDIEAEVRSLDRQLPGRLSGRRLIAVGAATIVGVTAGYWLWPFVLGALALGAALLILGAWATK